MTKIIAELCQNHNGDIKILEEMVHAAAESGADFAKIQSIDSSELTHRKRFDEGLVEGEKIKVIKRPFKAEYERLKKLDLSEKNHAYFIECCKKYNIKPMTTIFTLSKIDMVHIPISAINDNKKLSNGVLEGARMMKVIVINYDQKHFRSM